MTTALFANNATSTLAAAITDADTSLTLVTGQGALFPNPTAGDWFLVTLTQASGAETSWEIVKCTARVDDTLTIVRAQESTTAAAWTTAKVEHRLTAGSMPASGGSPFASDIVVNGINIGKGTGGAATNFNVQTGNLTAQQPGALFAALADPGTYTVTPPVYPNPGCFGFGVVLELVSGTCVTLPTINVTKFSTFLSFSPILLTINPGTSVGAVFTLPDIAGQWVNTGTKATWVVGIYPDTPNNTLAVGKNVLTAATGNSNLGIGINAGSAITTGSANVLIGGDTGSTIATSNGNLLISSLTGATKLHIGSANQLGIGGSNFGTSGQALKSGGAYGAAAWGDVTVPLTRVAITMTANYINLGANTALHYDVTNTGGYALGFVSWGYGGLLNGDEVSFQFLQDTTLTGGAERFSGISTPTVMKAGDVLVLRITDVTSYGSKVVAYYSTTPVAGASLGANLTAIDAMTGNGFPWRYGTSWYQAAYGEDGSRFPPATSTNNGGKVLTAGSSAGSMSWVTPSTSISRATIDYGYSSYLSPGSTDHIDLQNPYGLSPLFINHSLAVGRELTVQLLNDMTFNSGSYFLGLSANLVGKTGDVIVFRNQGSFVSRVVAYYPAAGFAGKVAPTLFQPTLVGMLESYTNATGTTLDVSLNTLFLKAVNEDTTYSLSNETALGHQTITLRLSFSNTHTITWWNGVKWPDGTAPTFVQGTYVIQFIGNSSMGWYGHVLGGNYPS